MVDYHTPTIIIDDDAGMRRTIVSMLRTIGFTDISQDDGQDALAQLRSRPFGLVLSDLHMMPLSGLDLLKLVREDAKLARLPFIMVTAEIAPELVKTALELGVDSYLVKPFDTQTLRRRVFQVLELVTARSLTARGDGSSSGELTQKLAALFDAFRATIRPGQTKLSPDIVALIRSYLDQAVWLGVANEFGARFDALMAEVPKEALTQTPHLNGVLLLSLFKGDEGGRGRASTR